MSDSYEEIQRFEVRCLPRGVYVVKDMQTGTCLSGESFEEIKAELLDSKERAPGGRSSLGPEGVPFLRGAWKPRNRITGSLGIGIVLISGLMLTGVGVRRIIPESMLQRREDVAVQSNSIFSNMRQGLITTARAFEDMEPRHREDLRLAFRSIAHSMTPFLMEFKPLIDDLTTVNDKNAKKCK